MDTQQGNGIEGAAMGNPNLSLGLGLRDFFFLQGITSGTYQKDYV